MDGSPDQPRQVHWIQAKKAREHLHDAEPGRIAQLNGNLLEVMVAGQRRNYQIIDPDGLAGLIDRNGQRVLVQERWSVLRLGNFLVAIRRW